MRTKQKTIIKIETHSLSVIRPLHSPVNFWCERCESVVTMVTPECAAEMVNKKPRAIYSHIETGELHFVETGEGEVFICCVSLQNNSLVKKEE